ncbi:MAG TPA: hypothetical protein VJS13_09500, partial [Pyrinomonadaceae bacterium]|nr:hypothetical protein [Pyrinomonadaceae bacterium]
MTSKKLKNPTMWFCVVLLSLIVSGSSNAQNSQIQSKRVVSVTKSVVNMRTLAEAEATATKSNKRTRGAVLQPPAADFQTMPVPGSIPEVNTGSKTSVLAEETPAQLNSMDGGGPMVPSPGPAQNFQGAIDEAVGGGPSGTFT